MDADEVVRDEEALLSAASNEAETACEDSTQCGEKENGDEELGPDVTVLVTGVQLRTIGICNRTSALQCRRSGSLVSHMHV